MIVPCAYCLQTQKATAGIGAVNENSVTVNQKTTATN
jgi:hypothetical protein